VQLESLLKTLNFNHADLFAEKEGFEKLIEMMLTFRQ
jgi:hypothetical protein